MDILKYNRLHLDFVDKKYKFPYTCSLDIHCINSMDQILVDVWLLNWDKAPTFREGMKYFRSTMNGCSTREMSR